MKRRTGLGFLLQAASATFGLVAVSSTVEATALGDLAAQMQPGEWRELTTANFQGMLLPNFAGDGSSPIIEFTDRAVRNPLNKTIYFLGCARGAPGGSGIAYVCGGTDAEDAGYISYDENANAWQRMPTAPVTSAPHAYDHSTINPMNGDFYYLECNQLTDHKVWKLSGGTWQNLPVPAPIYSGFGALEWFPEMNALLWVDGGDGFPPKVMVLPSGGSTWSPVMVNFPIGTIENFSEYSSKYKIVYFGGGTNGDKVLLKMDSKTAITRAADAPIPLGVFGFGGRQTVDPVSGNLIALETGAGGAGTGFVYDYDPVADQWSKNGTHPLGDADGNVIAILVPVPEYGVILAANYNRGNDKVYLYRHAAGTGTPIVTPRPPANVAAH